MKNIVLLSLLIAFCSNLPAYTAQKIYDEEEIRAIENCRYLGSSACYEDLFKTVDNDYVRLQYSYALYNEKQFDRAEEELITLKNKTRKNNYYVAAEKLLIKINALKEKVKDAYYEDVGHYISDLQFPARWEHPDNIKVYIQGETGLEYLFKDGFNVWQNSLSGLYFNYVQNIEEADIICCFIDHFAKENIGLTTFKGGIKIINGKGTIKSPVEVKISKKGLENRPLTQKELLSTIIHEIGHALGIQGHSRNKNDIMYENTESYQFTSLSDRDINTLYELYK